MIRMIWRIGTGSYYVHAMLRLHEYIAKLAGISEIQPSTWSHELGKVEESGVGVDADSGMFDYNLGSITHTTSTFSRSD